MSKDLQTMHCGKREQKGYSCKYILFIRFMYWNELLRLKINWEEISRARADDSNDVSHMSISHLEGT